MAEEVFVDSGVEIFIDAHISDTLLCNLCLRTFEILSFPRKLTWVNVGSDGLFIAMTEDNGRQWCTCKSSIILRS
jgi:hypothetical protein